MRKYTFTLLLLAFILLTGCRNSEVKNKYSISSAKINQSQSLNSNNKENTTDNTNSNSDNFHIKDSDKALISKKSMEYKLFYSGFVSEKDMFELPRGGFIIRSEKEWKEFKNKYFINCKDMDYTIEPDFSNDCILYYSRLSTLPDQIASAFQIENIAIVNSALDFELKKPETVNVTVSNDKNQFYRFVFLATINKSDLKDITVPVVQGTNEKWEAIDRLHFVQGTVISLKKISDGKSLLLLKVEKNYQNGPVDDEDYPFHIGDTVQFYINGQQNIDITKMKHIIVCESDVTTCGDDSFLAAEIDYYEKDGNFYDFKGKQISLPPQDYPHNPFKNRGVNK